MKQGRTGYGTMQIWIREIVKRGAACGMAAVLGLMTAIPWLPPFTVHAADGSGRRTILTSAYGDTDLGHKLYCIDRGGLALWGIADDGDVYECHRPSEASVPLSEMEKRYVFWAMVTQKAAMGDEKAGRVMECANAGAQAKGWPVIDSRVSEEEDVYKRQGVCNVAASRFCRREGDAYGRKSVQDREENSPWSAVFSGKRAGASVDRGFADGMGGCGEGACFIRGFFCR